MVCLCRRTRTRPTNQTQKAEVCKVALVELLLRVLVHLVVRLDPFPTRAWQCNHRHYLGPCAPSAPGDAWGLVELGGLGVDLSESPERRRPVDLQRRALGGDRERVEHEEVDERSPRRPGLEGLLPGLQG